MNNNIAFHVESEDSSIFDVIYLPDDLLEFLELKSDDILVVKKRDDREKGCLRYLAIYSKREYNEFVEKLIKKNKNTEGHSL